MLQLDVGLWILFEYFFIFINGRIPFLFATLDLCLLFSFYDYSPFFFIIDFFFFVFFFFCIIFVIFFFFFFWFFIIIIFFILKKKKKKNNFFFFFFFFSALKYHVRADSIPCNR